MVGGWVFLSLYIFRALVDLVIVCGYFTVIFLTAISGRQGKEVSTEEYFLSSRKLRWPSIALSSIATNINGYQFLGMMGSAYLFGLAQASLEINAIQGILMAAFIFVPLYLKEKVITVTQFINKKLGRTTGLIYSLANLGLFSTVTLGAALFWGAYAAEAVFEDYLSFINHNSISQYVASVWLEGKLMLEPGMGDKLVRISALIIFLGIFSAIYTYFGGLSAVVKTDIIQFSILLVGGFVVLFVSIDRLGGWGQLYEKTPQLMHLHLPADHKELPWIHIFGLFLLNINYWCANQTIVQRSLAARSLKDAQIGLMVGGVMKYVMAVLIVIPGIALVGILGENGLSDPDQAFPFLVSTLSTGVKGIILCALFASLMSTVDSTFNSLATLWSIDIYKTYLKKHATDREVVNAGRQTILLTLFTGVSMGLVLMYLKYKNPDAAFTHTLNALRYYINCGIVVLICVAAFIISPNKLLVRIAFFSTPVLHLTFQYFFPEMNYFVRSMWVILIAFALASAWLKRWTPPGRLFHADSMEIIITGLILLLSLAAVHMIFH